MVRQFWLSDIMGRKRKEHPYAKTFSVLSGDAAQR